LSFDHKDEFLSDIDSDLKYISHGFETIFSGNENNLCNVHLIDGKYILNGKKRSVVGNMSPKYEIIFAKDEKNELNLVVKENAGFEIKLNDKNEFEFFLSEKTFEEEELSGNSCVIKLDKKYESQIENFMIFKQLGMSEIALALSMKSFDLTLKYARERIVFKQKLTDFQFIQLKFIEMETMIFLMKALLHVSKKYFVNDCKEKKSISIICKILTAEFSSQINQECMQVYGANGLLNEIHIPKFVKFGKMLELMDVGMNEGIKVLMDFFQSGLNACHNFDLKINDKLNDIHMDCSDLYSYIDGRINDPDFYKPEVLNMLKLAVTYECAMIYSSDLLSGDIGKNEEAQVMRINKYLCKKIDDIKERINGK
jgi:hypothetical protein